MASNRNLLGLVEAPDETASKAEPVRVRCSAAPPLSLMGTALAVFLGNLLTAVLGAAVYAVIRSL